MDRASAETRFQLGWRAAERGWLDEDGVRTGLVRQRVLMKVVGSTAGSGHRGTLVAMNAPTQESRLPMHRPTTHAAASLALLVTFAVSCAGGGGPRLVIPGGEGSFAASVEYDHERDEPSLLTSAFVVCIDRPGEVRITDVRFDHVVGDLQVSDFGVVPHGTRFDYPEDARKVRLRELGFSGGPVVVDTVCPEQLTEEEQLQYHPQWFSDVGIEFIKPHRGNARGMTLVLVYDSAGREREVRQGFELVLCGPDDSPEPGEFPPEVCAPWPIERYETGEELPVG
jgi:hypothetical protein